MIGVAAEWVSVDWKIIHNDGDGWLQTLGMLPQLRFDYALAFGVKCGRPTGGHSGKNVTDTTTL